MGKTKMSKEVEGSMDKPEPQKPLQTEGPWEGASTIHTFPETLQLHLDEVLEATTASRETLEQKIETVVVDMTLLRADQRKLAERVTVTEMTFGYAAGSGCQQHATGGITGMDNGAGETYGRLGGKGKEKQHLRNWSS